MACAGGTRDWRNAEDYSRLAALPRAAFAWEWLRRRPDYALARSRSSGGPGPSSALEAAKWNLHQFEDPALDALDARPLWRRSAFPAVVRAEASPARSSDGCDFRRFGTLVSMVEVAGVQHLMIADSGRWIRLDVSGMSVRDGPVALDFRLTGFEQLGAQLVALAQLRALALTGRFRAALQPSVRTVRRMLLLLRASDALGEGATQRDIAFALLAPSGDLNRWRSESPSLRSQAQRLVRGARAMSANGFWKLLRNA